MPPKKLRILFLGASLVAGYSSWGAVYHPFSQNVVKMLRMTLPGTDIETVVDGVPGDLVTRGKFLERMQKHCKIVFPIRGLRGSSLTIIDSSGGQGAI